MGIKKYVALSTGEYEDSINPFKKYQDKLAQAQRRLAKKKKFSENWKKQKITSKKYTAKLRMFAKIFNTSYQQSSAIATP